MTLNFATATTENIPEQYQFWYRLALLDVQGALIDFIPQAGQLNGAEAISLACRGVSGQWNALFELEQQAKNQSKTLV